MSVPVAIYLVFDVGGPAAHGWGAAMSTDTAFMLGMLTLAAPASRACERGCSRSRCSTTWSR
jgi:Na+/H+ antiporter NhaA